VCGVNILIIRLGPIPSTLIMVRADVAATEVIVAKERE
jgi:hypothetical protein